GFPGGKIAIKPNCPSGDPGGVQRTRLGALFVGRLSKEKGLETLAAAWRLLPDIRLAVAGDGPLALDWASNVSLLGSQSRDQVVELMGRSQVTIVPSVWYETGPLTVLESFACGTPVIASDLGSMAERVQHHRTGLLFRPGDPEDLAAKVRWAFEHPEAM